MDVVKVTLGVTETGSVELVTREVVGGEVALVVLVDSGAVVVPGSRGAVDGAGDVAAVDGMLVALDDAGKVLVSCVMLVDVGDKL